MENTDISQMKMYSKSSLPPNYTHTENMTEVNKTCMRESNKVIREGKDWQEGSLHEVVASEPSKRSRKEVSGR